MADWRNPPKLYIPGPIQVADDVLKELSRPVIGHRGKEYAQLHAETTDMLKKILFTNQHVFLSTSSASGIWEASIRNCVAPDETVLATGCGAFSDKWADVAVSCGRKVETLKVDWGKPITADLVDKKLSEGKYAAITLVHNETSTGLMNPLEDIAQMMKKKYPNVLVFVDSVSGMIGLPLKFDEWGWDVAFASVQKAFGLPPGFAVAVVSKRALEKSKSVPNRGYYFNFEEWAKSAEKNQTLVTPSEPHIYGLHYQCEKFIKEGMENVWARHKKMADFVRGWAKKRFALFCDEKYASNTLTCVKNTRNINVADVIAALHKNHNVVFGNGYKKLKEATFRIAHMGDISLEDMQKITSWIDEIIG